MAWKCTFQKSGRCARENVARPAHQYCTFNVNSVLALLLPHNVACLNSDFLATFRACTCITLYHHNHIQHHNQLMVYDCSPLEFGSVWMESLLLTYVAATDGLF
jgi:hypothetical protein